MQVRAARAACKLCMRRCCCCCIARPNLIVCFTDLNARSPSLPFCLLRYAALRLLLDPDRLLRCVVLAENSAAARAAGAASASLLLLSTNLVHRNIPTLFKVQRPLPRVTFAFCLLLPHGALSASTCDFCRCCRAAKTLYSLLQECKCLTCVCCCYLTFLQIYQNVLRALLRPRPSIRCSRLRCSGCAPYKVVVAAARVLVCCCCCCVPCSK